MPGRVSRLSNNNLFWLGPKYVQGYNDVLFVFLVLEKTKIIYPPWFMGKCDTGKDNNRLMLTLSLQTYTDHACIDCCMLLVIVSFQIFKFMLCNERFLH